MNLAKQFMAHPYNRTLEANKKNILWRTGCKTALQHVLIYVKSYIPMHTYIEKTRRMFIKMSRVIIISSDWIQGDFI